MHFRIRNAFIRQVEIQGFLKEFVVVVGAYIQHVETEKDISIQIMYMSISGYLQHMNTVWFRRH